MPTSTVGFVSLVRPTFDTTLAGQLTQQLWAQLVESDLQPVDDCNMIISSDQAQSVVDKQRGKPLDLLLVFQASFADSTHILDIPVLQGHRR